MYSFNNDIDRMSQVQGNINFTDIDALTYDSGTDILYGVESESGTDVLIQINMATGAHVPNAFGANLDYVPVPAVLGNDIHTNGGLGIDLETNWRKWESITGAGGEGLTFVR